MAEYYGVDDGNDNFKLQHQTIEPEVFHAIKQLLKNPKFDVEALRKQALQEDDSIISKHHSAREYEPAPLDPTLLEDVRKRKQAERPKLGLKIITASRAGVEEVVIRNVSFADCSWSTSIEDIKEFEGNVIINPNAVVAVEAL